QAGVYYIAAANFGPGAASITVTATVTGGPTPTPTPGPGGNTVALTSGAPQTGSIPAPQQAGGGVLGETQYTIQIPSTVTQLKVDLRGNQDVDLFVRFGARIAIQGGSVIADFKSESETGNESITITPGSSPALQAGVYYIAAGNFGPGAANITVTATVTGGGGGCSYSISPTSRSIGASGGLGNVSVTAGNGCNWTATSSANFINLLAPASGSGSGSVTYSVAANTGAGSRTGTLTVAGQTFTLTQDGAGNPPGNRVVRVGQAGGAPGGQVSVPIELVAQGDENALGFSLTFDPAVLGNPQAASGSDAAGATLNANASQAGSGRLGIALSLPFGQKFSAGTRQIVVVSFAISGGASASSTQMGFGDQPIAREISDVNAGALQASYAPGAVSLTSGFEADVAPRPNGNGTVTITDWVQIGRFVAGQDTPSGGEFQRADTAPRDSRGNGSLTITDWVQAGRYAAGLDALTPAGGPSSQTSQSGSGLTAGSRYAQAADASGSRNVRISSGYFERGQQSSVIIELGAEGNENALGFSLNFNPAQLRFVSAAVARDTSGATLNVNTSQASMGRIGVAMALPAGQTIQAGQRQIIVINFAVATEGEATTATIGFGDQPVTRELSDANANSLPVSFSGGTLTLTRSVTSVSAASFTGQSLASEAIVAAFGQNLATQVAVAETLPLPTTLAGTTVKVRDSAGEERLAPLFFVAPAQINYQIPVDTAAGEATVTITSGNAQVSTGMLNIAAVAPGLFSAASSGQGVAAAIVLRVKAGGAQSYEPVARYDAAQNRFVALPIDLGGEGDQVFLILYGTGFRHRRDLAAVTVRLGDVETAALFAGGLGEFAGLDQLNLRIPRSLAGRGEVDVTLNADGHESNRVKVHIK
ncbi:MAG: BACON domain-containing protein, partial [Blastocatellia bacterium]